MSKNTHRNWAFLLKPFQYKIFVEAIDWDFDDISTNQAKQWYREQSKKENSYE